MPSRRTSAVALVCRGLIDQQSEQRCGAVYPVSDPAALPAGWPRPTQADIETAARVRGWRIGPTLPDGTKDAMCPACAKPDPITAAHIRDIERSLHK